MLTRRSRLVTVVALGSLVLGSPAAMAIPGGGGEPALVGDTLPALRDSDADKLDDALEAQLAAGATSVRVLVGGTSSVTAGGTVEGLAVHREFRLVPGFVATVAATAVAELATLPGVTRIEIDSTVSALDAAGARDFGLDAARRDSRLRPADGGLDGTGVGLCVLDTGIDPRHEQLAARSVGFLDLVGARRYAYDDNGHGTHTVSVAAGDGAGGPLAADHAGVAPAAALSVVKVLDAEGNGRASNVVAGLEWCAEQPGVKVLLVPLGGGPSDGGDLVSAAATAAAAAGKVVVTAAGNTGDALDGLAAPAAAPATIAVGAAADASAPTGSDSQDGGIFLAPWSSRGVVGGRLPDLVAPGVSVRAAAVGTRDGYVTLSGTSVAAAYVAGLAALGLEQVPEATAQDIRAALTTGSVDRGADGPDPDWGAGTVDARRFLTTLTETWVSAPSASLVRMPVTVADTPQTIEVPVLRQGGALAATVLLAGQRDLDVELYSPSGVLTSESRCPAYGDIGCFSGRQETLGVPWAEAGTWRLVVNPVEAGAPQVAYVDVIGGVPNPTIPRSAGR